MGVGTLILRERPHAHPVGPARGRPSSRGAACPTVQSVGLGSGEETSAEKAGPAHWPEGCPRPGPLLPAPLGCRGQAGRLSAWLAQPKASRKL